VSRETAYPHTESTVSDLSKDLNDQIEAWNERPLDDLEYPFALVGAMQINVRRQGAVRSTSALVLVGRSRDHQRESSFFSIVIRPL